MKFHTVSTASLLATAAAVPGGFGVYEGPQSDYAFTKSDFPLGGVGSFPVFTKHAYSDPILNEQTATPFGHLHTFLGSGCIHRESIDPFLPAAQSLSAAAAAASHRRPA